MASKETQERLDAEVAAGVEEAIAVARAGTVPDASEAMEDIYVEPGTLLPEKGWI